MWKNIIDKLIDVGMVFVIFSAVAIIALMAIALYKSMYP